jgi:DNA polymerase-3 subunit delta'
MRFSEFTGNRDSAARLKERIRQGTSFHAYLIDGPEGIGKRRLAYTAAQALMCEDPRDGEPCGECPACRKVMGGNHADLHYITTDGSSIKDEQIEGIQGILFSKPFDGDHTILIIDKADTMTARAQNRLLKTLEEPARSVRVFLLTEKRSDILPTIVSRSVVIRLKPVEAEEIRQFLINSHGADEKDAEIAAACSGGCPGKAVRLLQDEDFKQRRERSITCAKALAEAGSLPEFMKTLEEDLTDKEEVLEFLDMVLLWYRDLLLLDLKAGNEIMNRDRAEELALAGEKVSRKQILRTLEELENAKQDILMNANKGYVIRNMYLKIRR